MSIIVTSTPNTKLAAVEPKVEAKAETKSVADESAETLEASDAAIEQELNGDSEPEDSSEESDEKPKAKKSGVQKRIDKITKARSEAERERDYWKAEALKNQSQPAKEEKIETPKKADQKGKPTKPDLNKFDSHEAYEAARDDYFEQLAEWKAEQKLAEREAKQKEEIAKSQFKKRESDYLDAAGKFSKENPDFNDLVSELDVKRMSMTVNDAIMRHGPALAYEFAKDPEEFYRISALPPIEAAEAIGEIKSRIKAKDSPKEKEVKASNAPAPLKAVGGGSSKSAKSITDPNISQAEYEALRREQMKRKSAWG